jgi:hypothetical protein
LLKFFKAKLPMAQNFFSKTTYTRTYSKKKVGQPTKLKLQAPTKGHDTKDEETLKLGALKGYVA